MGRGMSELPASKLAEKMVREFFAEAREKGEAFWSDHEIVERFGVTRHYAREAKRLLVLHGLLERHRGSGTYVARTDLDAFKRMPKLIPHPAVLLPEWDRHYETAFMVEWQEGFAEHAKRKGWSISFSYQDDIAKNFQMAGRLIAAGCNAIVLLDCREEHVPVMSELRHSDVPIVECYGSLRGAQQMLRLSTVDSDEKDAAYRLGRQLQVRGVRRLAMVGAITPLQRFQARAAGLREAFEGQKISIMELPGIEEACRAVHDLLANPKSRPQTIIFNDSHLLLGVEKAVPALGAAMKAGMHVAVFDEIFLNKKRPDFPVISLQLPTRKMGGITAEMLDRLVRISSEPLHQTVKRDILWPENG